MSKMTLLDLAKLNGSDAVVGLIEESIQAAPELSIIPGRTIKGTSYKALLRTGLPTVGFRSLNEGVTPSKSTFEEKLVQAYILASRIEVDKASLNGTDRSPSEIKAIEGAGVMEAALRKIGSQVFYGVASDTKGFPGLQAMVHDDLVLDAGGTTATTGSSVYAVRLGDRAVSFVFGNETTFDLGAFREESLTDANSKKFPGEVADLCAWVGLQCVSKQVVGRIKDLTADSGKGLTDALVSELLSKWVGPSPDVLFMNRRSAYQLQKSRSVTIQSSAKDKADGALMGFAPSPTESNGIKIVVTDQITSTEALS
jgi:hypothetical protein